MSFPSRCDAWIGSWYTLAHTAPISAYTLGQLPCALRLPSPFVPGVPGETPGAKYRAEQPMLRRLLIRESVPSCVSSQESPGYGPIVSLCVESEVVRPPVYPEW